jgi:hypothetical protein
MPETYANATIGGRARRGGAGERNRNGGTGSIPARSFAWITEGRRQEDGPSFSERGVVATRQALDALRPQMHGEAWRRGFGPGALVIADGAAGIWRLAADRFPEARQRLDFYHAVQHLASVGRALFGEDKAKC